MPTGYTAKLMEQGEDFSTFTLRCARAFGACVMMRDDDIDAPIPEKFEPSDYSVKALAQAERNLKRLSKMTPAQQQAYGIRAKRKDVANHKKRAENNRAENARLDAMTKQVGAWEPDPALAEMKRFMLEQLRISRNDCGYWDELTARSEAKPTIEYYTDALAEAASDIKYHREEIKKENERVDARNDWLRKLRASLPA